VTPLAAHRIVKGQAVRAVPRDPVAGTGGAGAEWDKALLCSARDQTIKGMS